METHLVERIQAIPSKKKESVESIAGKIVIFLDGLHAIEPNLFNDWYETALSKKEALQKKVLINTKFIEDIVRKEWDKKVPALGSKFSFWSGKDELENVNLSFGLGKTVENKNIGNVVNISFPFDKTLRLKKDDKKIDQIVNLMKKCWDPITVKVE